MSGTLPSRAGEIGVKDRRAGLVLFGVISILIGVFFGLLAVITPVLIEAAKVAPASQVAGQTPSPRADEARAKPAGQPAGLDLRGEIVGVALYSGIAALFIWAGVGSLRLRRWSRTIMVIVSWTWLLCGLLGLVFWILMLPDLPNMLQAANPAEPGDPDDDFTDGGSFLG